MYVSYWHHKCPKCGLRFTATLDVDAAKLGPGYRKCGACGTTFADGSKEWNEMSTKERRRFLLPSEVVVCLGTWLFLTAVALVVGWSDIQLALAISGSTLGFFALLLSPFYIMWWLQIRQSKRRFTLRVFGVPPSKV